MSEPLPGEHCENLMGTGTYIHRHRWLRLESEERQRIFDAASALMQNWNTDWIQASLPRWVAIRGYCLQHDLAVELANIVACSPEAAYLDPLVERGRVFARYPHFRDGCGIPDSCFDITDGIKLRQRVDRIDLTGTMLRLSGEAYLTYLGGFTTIVLRRWPRGRRYHFPTDSVPTPRLRDRDASYPRSGFTSVIDLATARAGRPLNAGSWELLVNVGPAQLNRAAPLRLARKARVAPTRSLRPGPKTHTCLYVARGGRLRLSVGVTTRIRPAQESEGQPWPSTRNPRTT